MLSRHSDPIAAIATAPGRGAVGIVRVSGADVSAVVEAICDRTLKPREATYLAFRDDAGVAIDQGLAIHFPAPHSFTGEDVLELHAHGGNVVLQILLARCLQAGKAQGMRPARPGEFSQRAFLNGKIDLAQAEAIADLIDASTETAARSAARSLSGDFSVEIGVLLKALTDLRMVVEASLDFPEEDVDILQQADARGRISRLQASLDQIQQKARQGLLLREGIKVVIAGQPNAGKSSLLNALAGAELAIVSAIAGTTRDKVQQTIQIEGVPVHVIDTAGLRDSADEIEQIGVARTWAEIDAADAILFLHDLVQSADAVGHPDDGGARGSYQQADARIASALAARLHVDVPIVHVWNKVDLVAEVQQSATERSVHVSAKTGQGLADLRQILLRLAGWQSVPEGVYMARERHLQALQRVTQHVQASARHIEAPAPALDVLAEELRLAQNALSEITGAFGADDLLGVIFSRFCIGK